MAFFKYKSNLYPLFAIASALLIMIFGLIMAKTVACSYFLIGAFVWLLLFGCCRQAIKTLPLFVIIGRRVRVDRVLFVGAKSRFRACDG